MELDDAPFGVPCLQLPPLPAELEDPHPGALVASARFLRDETGTGADWNGTNEGLPNIIQPT